MRRLGLEVVGHGDLQSPTTTRDLRFKRAVLRILMAAFTESNY